MRKEPLCWIALFLDIVKIMFQNGVVAGSEKLSKVIVWIRVRTKSAIVWLFFDWIRTILCLTWYWLTFNQNHSISIAVCVIEPICSQFTLCLRPESIKNHMVHWCFQGVEKGCIGNKWVNIFISEFCWCNWKRMHEWYVFFFLEIFGAGKLQKLVKTKERGIFGT